MQVRETLHSTGSLGNPLVPERLVYYPNGGEAKVPLEPSPANRPPMQKYATLAPKMAKTEM